jgi:hypothetical protein
MSVKAVIFSFNRALQVEGTLHSFYLRCKDSKQVEMYVLYRASSLEHESQYEVLKQAYPQVIFLRETNFRHDLGEILKSFYPSNVQKTLLSLVEWANSFRSQNTTPSSWFLRKVKKIVRWLPSMYMPVPDSENYVMFMVDDNIFIRDFSIGTTIKALQSVRNAIGFSLRLGLNTTFCYPMDAPQKIPEYLKIQENVLAHEWTSAQYDFNYPLEVSSSIYRASDIVPFLLGLSYANPNTLEGEMAAQSCKFAARFPKLLWFDASVAFCNPINKVQTVLTDNRAAVTHYYTIEDLAQKFDREERIDVDFYNKFIPNACHQEVELKFTSIK